MTSPATIPAAYGQTATPGVPFGRTPDTRAVEVVRKEFVKVLLDLAAHQGAADVFRRWACWWAYAIAFDVAATPVDVEGELAERQKAWCKELQERRDGNAKWLETLNKDWLTLSCKMLKLMAEGLEAEQGDFLSHVLERGLEGTNKWNGQFFTPSNVGLMMGRMLFNRNIKHGWIETFCDPCCGCGCLPIAGAKAFLNDGGHLEDICVDVADIDEGAVCTCFVQCTALNIATRAQCMDTLRMEPHGPMMVSPAYIFFETGRRLRAQKLIEQMGELLRTAPKKAAGVPAEATETAEATATPPEPQGTPAASVEPRATPPKGVPSCERGTAPDGLGAKRFLESGQGVLF